MTLLLKAEPVVKSLTAKLQQRCAALKLKGIIPKMNVILVGNNASSQVYVQHKKKKCQEIGAICEVIELSSNISKELFLDAINRSNSDPQVHGIIIQLPLPKSLVIDVNSLVWPEKDIDGFGKDSVFQLFSGSDPDAFLAPCTPKGVIKLLRHYEIPVSGKKVAIIGRSHIVGKPLGLMMLNADATVSMCHSKTQDLKQVTLHSDIILAALGRPHFLTKDYFRNDKSQTVVDIGIHRQNNILVGDVDFAGVYDHVSAITPVPGGVGPMTVLTLVENLILAATQASAQSK